MSKAARAYWLLVVISGLCLSASALSGWRPSAHEILRLGFYILAGVATSGLKVSLPGIFCTLSVNYVFIIAGLNDLHLAGGILIGAASVVGQGFFKPKSRPRWHHTVFN